MVITAKSFEPCSHTKLINVAIWLGKKNSLMQSSEFEVVEPVLFNAGYSLKVIAPKISLPELGPNHAACPDLVYYSSTRNEALLIECKSGNHDEDQSTKYNYVSQHPETILRRPIIPEASANLSPQIMLFSTDGQILQSHASSIPFPSIELQESTGMIKKITSIPQQFANQAIEAKFTQGVAIRKLSVILYPFGPEDFQGNIDYVCEKIILGLIGANLKVKGRRGVPVPTLDQIVADMIPTYNLLSDLEKSKILSAVEGLLKRLFDQVVTKEKPDISRFISKKKNRIYLKKTTLPRAIILLQEAFEGIRENTEQRSLVDFDPSPEIVSPYDDFLRRFPTTISDIFGQADDQLNSDAQ